MLTVVVAYVPPASVVPCPFLSHPIVTGVPKYFEWKCEHMSLVWYLVVARPSTFSHIPFNKSWSYCFFFPCAYRKSAVNAVESRPFEVSAIRTIHISNKRWQFMKCIYGFMGFLCVLPRFHPSHMCICNSKKYARCSHRSTVFNFFFFFLLFSLAQFRSIEVVNVFSNAYKSEMSIGNNAIPSSFRRFHTINSRSFVHNEPRWILNTSFR